MTKFLEIAVAWTVPCLIATAIIGPMVWRKLRARRTLEAIHHARENREL
ncbi:conserved transmembrane protein (fragment) (plasmid) [Ralstonia solanacearum CMR15]